MRVVLIDDARSILIAIENALRKQLTCEVFAFQDPLVALQWIEGNSADLVMVDYCMPGLSGVEVIEALRSKPATRTVPIIMVTSNEDRAVKLAAIEAGATEFLNKPFDENELRIRVRNLLDIRRAQLSLAEKARSLDVKYQEAMASIHRREEEIIWRLSKAIGIRDGDTGDHIDRVSVIASMIAEEMGLEPAHCRMIFLASPLHDVGKLGVPDAILLKPGKLTTDEYLDMQRHTQLGADILGGSSSDLIRVAESIAANHHERWDGTGYPHQRRGEDIPIEARIVSIADVLDALCSDRPYKKAWPTDTAFREIVDNSGTHFDPTCVAAFCRRWPQIRAMFEQSNTFAPASEPMAMAN
jgi:putative two-component system response regulator